MRRVQRGGRRYRRRPVRGRRLRRGVRSRPFRGARRRVRRSATSIRRFRLVNNLFNTKAYVRLRMSANSVQNIAGAAFGIWHFDLATGFPDLLFPSAGYQNFAWYSLAWAKFRIYRVSYSMRLFSSTAPTSTNPDIFSVANVFYDGGATAYNADVASFNKAIELPGGRFIQKVVNNDRCQVAFLRGSVLLSDLLGMSKEVYRVSPATWGSTAAPAGLNPARTYAAPACDPVMSVILSNGGSNNRTFNCQIQFWADIEFSDFAGPLSNN
ncbi:capsid protein [Chifec virus UA13_111]|nr:capsid protein [Chifec virus UA13_111]